MTVIVEVIINQCNKVVPPSLCWWQATNVEWNLLQASLIVLQVCVRAQASLLLFLSYYITFFLMVIYFLS